MSMANAQQGADLKHIVLQKVLVAHGAYFDVCQPYEYAGETFDGYAEFHSYGEKFLLSKSAKLWEVNAHEYLFFKLVNHLDETLLAEGLSFVESKASDKVNPVANHMVSYVSLVFVADSVSEDVCKQVRRTRFYKSFALGLRGRIELRLAVVDLASSKVITNAAGKDLRKALESNLSIAAKDLEKTAEKDDMEDQGKAVAKTALEPVIKTQMEMEAQTR